MKILGFANTSPNELKSMVAKYAKRKKWSKALHLGTKVSADIVLCPGVQYARKGVDCKVLVLTGHCVTLQALGIPIIDLSHQINSFKYSFKKVTQFEFNRAIANATDRVDINWNPNTLGTLLEECDTTINSLILNMGYYAKDAAKRIILTQTITTWMFSDNDNTKDLADSLLENGASKDNVKDLIAYIKGAGVPLCQATREIYERKKQGKTINHAELCEKLGANINELKYLCKCNRQIHAVQLVDKTPLELYEERKLNRELEEVEE